MSSASSRGPPPVVLSRDASNRRLLAATDANAIAGLGDRLERAAPRDCLAVRRGGAYERRAGHQPLQPCAICGDLPGASRCTPSLVGGEVIGSLLVTHHKAVEPAAANALSSAVNEAAPVLANLRNLAIAEHRAATDGLTGLPNARSMRETLLRVVAQAGRTVTPLSAIAMDLERVKSLNDRYGHQAGDEALAAVGAILRSGCARAASPAAGAARSSSCSCPAPAPTARRRWRRSCAPRSGRRACRPASPRAWESPRCPITPPMRTACCATRTARSTRPSTRAAIRVEVAATGDPAAA